MGVGEIRTTNVALPVFVVASEKCVLWLLLSHRQKKERKKLSSISKEASTGKTEPAVSIFSSRSFHHCTSIAHSDLQIGNKIRGRQKWWNVKSDVDEAQLDWNMFSTAARWANDLSKTPCTRMHLCPSIRAQQSSRNMEVLLQWRRNVADSTQARVRVRSLWQRQRVSHVSLGLIE